MESESLGRVSEKLDMKGVVVGKVLRSVDGRSCWKRLLLIGTAAVLCSAMGSLARPKLSQKWRIALSYSVLHKIFKNQLLHPQCLNIMNFSFT